ncbi:MAG: ABC transporter permease [Oscillospiraceae bacterium]|nr:ABC transporter permease [Oscillospiraceae bacterium]
MRDKKSRVPGRIFLALIYIFLYAPIIVLLIFSFNSTNSRTVWSGFSLRWYEKLFNDDMVINALYTTISVSILAAIIATVFGTFAAIGIFNLRRRWQSPVLTLNNIPLMNADIVTGVSLCLLFVASGTILGFGLGFITLLLAHISFNVPYVILSVMPKLKQLDNNLVDAAQDLGCTWLQAFFKVVVPEIKPGIVNGALIAFTMSIDDFIISYFTAGSGTQTLSMVIFSMTRKRVTPEINAVSSLMFVFVLILLIIINIRSSVQDKKLRAKPA